MTTYNKNNNINIGKRTVGFKIEIGTTFKDENRDITIIGRKYEIKIKKNGSKLNEKLYRYRCNVCEYDEGWIIERGISYGVGCSCCANQVFVQGINDIPTTAPFMVKFFQGGYEEAKLYTYSGGGNPNNKDGKIYPICPKCGKIKDELVYIYNIYKRHHISCMCSDFIPYPEKIMFSVLEQLKVKFQHQLIRNTFNWCDKYKYDFYLNDFNIIIETNGMQHYEDTGRKDGRTAKEETENDRVKKELALDNGIKEENYIVIDCRYSKLEFIKNKVLHSKLNNFFDLSIIDWNKAEEYTLSDRMKEACAYKKDNNDLSTTDIGDLMGYKRGIVLKWLKLGTKFNLCEYNADDERKKAQTKRGQHIEIFKENVSLGVLSSITSIEKASENLFGIKLPHTSVSIACSNQKQYKGFTFVKTDKPTTK